MGKLLKIGVPIILLLAVIAGEVFVLSQVGTAEPVGVWKDVDDEYYISFDPSGTYVETTYNLPRRWEVRSGGILILSDITGNEVAVELTKCFESRVVVTLNGDTHVMAPFDGLARLSSWMEPEASEFIGSFKVRGDFSDGTFIRLSANKVYSGIIEGEAINGKYAIDPAGNLLLFGKETGVEAIYRPWEMGYVCGKMESNLASTLELSNPLQNRGYTLNGICTYGGTSYSFRDNNTVERESADGGTSSFIYFANPNGLVTMTDTAGMGVRDYIYYDADTGDCYRYILEEDDWFNYISTNN